MSNESLKANWIALSAIGFVFAAQSPVAAEIVWQFGPAMPLPRGHIAAAKDNLGRIYVAGGSAAPGITTSEVMRFDESTWEILPHSLNVARHDAAVAADQLGRIYAIGGCGSGMQLSSVERFDPSDPDLGWVFVTPLPAVRCEAEAVTDSIGRIILCGGQNTDSGCMSSCLVFDPGHPELGWQAHSNMLQGRHTFGFTIDSQDRLYAVGGQCNAAHTDTAERFDPDLGTWSFIDSINSARHVGTAVADCEGFVYAIGGWEPGASCTVERFDPLTELWEDATPINQCRNTIAGILGDSGRLYAIGGDAGSAGLTTVEFAEILECEPPLCEATESAKLTASDGAQLDNFGAAVAVDGDVAVVGAVNQGNPGNNMGFGKAYVFEFDGGAWFEVSELTPSDPQVDQEFGGRVAIEGDTIVVGAAQDNGGLNGSGAAYIFVKEGGVWLQKAKVTASDAAPGDSFGSDLGISGDFIVVGALNNEDAGNETGSAYVFEKPPAGWVDMTETQKLLPLDATAGDRLGQGAAIHGNTIVIGAEQQNTGPGKAYVFERQSGVWVETAILLASDGAGGDFFGFDVAVRDDLICVGALKHDHNANDAGSAYIFERPVGGWASMTETAKLLACDGMAGDNFGISVSIDEEHDVLVGAYAGDGGGPGSAYVFTEPATGWGSLSSPICQSAKLIASDATAGDRFGIHVSVNGPWAFVGAHLDDDASNDSGSVYVFRGISDCNGNETLDICDIGDSVSEDCNANGIPDECDIGGGSWLQAGLIAWWRMEDKDGTQIPDASGNAHDLTVLGSPTFEGDLVIFDDDGNLVAEDSDALDLLADWSVSYWAREDSRDHSPNTNPSNGWMGKVRNYGDAEGGWFLNSSDDVRVRAALYGTPNCSHDTEFPLTLGVWYRITTTYEAASDTLRIYLNGVMEHETVGVTCEMLANSHPLVMGGYLDSDLSVVPYCKGALADVRIYDRAISVSDIHQLTLTANPAGPSADCNANGVPDECDIADCPGDPACGDCNMNGVPDGCDIAGGPIAQFIDSNGDGAGNGLSGPQGIVVDPVGNAYVSGFLSDNAFKITPGGAITEIIDATGDGIGNTLDGPNGIVVDGVGNVYVAASNSNNAFCVSSGGAISELIDAGDGCVGPIGIAVDIAGNLYLACVHSDNAFKITPGVGIMEIIDATGDGAGNGLDGAYGIAVDTAGNAYVTGVGSDNAFKITLDGMIDEIIDANGDGAGNGLEAPNGIAVDAAGNVFVAASNSNNAFKITPAGVVTEIIDATGDGMGNGLLEAEYVAVNANGNAYVTGSNSSNAFKITPSGVVSEIIDATGDGAGNVLGGTVGIFVDSAGNVYVTGAFSNNAFKIPPSGDCNGNGIPDGCESVSVFVDIKPGSCPNSFNPDSNGVLPIAILGTANFDASMIDVGSVLLSRADGVGGQVAPHEGPPGPQSTFEDVATPFEGETCDCHDLGGDGIVDLSLKFKTDDVVDVLELDELPAGALVELVVSGSLLDGTPISGSDCIRLVPPGTPDALLSVTSNLSGAWVDVTPLDNTLDGGGFTNFVRNFPETTVVTLSAETSVNNKPLVGWIVDGQFVEANGAVPWLPSASLKHTLIAGQAAAVEILYGPPTKKPAPNPGPGVGTGGKQGNVVELNQQSDRQKNTS